MHEHPPSRTALDDARRLVMGAGGGCGCSACEGTSHSKTDAPEADRSAQASEVATVEVRDPQPIARITYVPSALRSQDAASAVVYWIGLAESVTGEPSTKDLTFGQQILTSSTMVREAILAAGAETLGAFVEASPNPDARVKQMAWTARAEFYFTRMLRQRGVSFESYSVDDVIRAVLDEAEQRGRLESVLARLGTEARERLLGHLFASGGRGDAMSEPHHAT